MLTEARVRNAKVSDRPMKLPTAGGLYLSLMPNGGRYWRFDYRFHGKRKTLALGSAPHFPFWCALLFFGRCGLLPVLHRAALRWLAR